MFKKFAVLSMVILVVGLLVAGCATNGSVGEEPGGNETESAAEDTSLSRVLDAGVFSVAGSGGYPPFNYYEGENVIGFDVDTGRAIAAELDVELDYVTTAWDGIVEGLRVGHYDAVLGSMAITDERLEVVNFTIPYYYSGAQLVVLDDSGITDPEQMDGKTIGVATGTTFADDAEALGAEVNYYDDDTLTLTELLNGRIDGVITDRLVVVRAINEMPGGERLTMVGELLRLEEMALAVRKGEDELLAELNRILQNMHDNGTLTGISEEWFEGLDITKK